MKENQSCNRILADTVLINECKNRIQKKVLFLIKPVAY